MVEIKYYCDRCKKEINYDPHSTITIQSESKVVAQKDGKHFLIPRQEYLFGFDEQEFMLCPACGRRFKKYWDQYMKEEKVNIT